MDKLKSLLLPLALVFAGIAVFEAGVRYGSTNMRAHAIAEQMQMLTQLRVSVRSEEHGNAQVPVVPVAQLDNLIALGAVHRQIWYLDSKAQEVLDKTLTFVLSARGPDNVIKNIELAKESKEGAQISEERVDKIIEAIRQAKVDLIENAPSAEAAPEEAQ